MHLLIMRWKHWLFKLPHWPAEGPDKEAQVLLQDCPIICMILTENCILFIPLFSAIGLSDKMRSQSSRLKCLPWNYRDAMDDWTMLRFHSMYQRSWTGWKCDHQTTPRMLSLPEVGARSSTRNSGSSVSWGSSSFMSLPLQPLWTILESYANLWPSPHCAVKVSSGSGMFC